MAINVKKLKRVRLHSIGGIEVLETLNSGDKKPAFRQNGYEVDGITKKAFALEFDAANSEYVNIPQDLTWADSTYIDFSIDYDVLDESQNTVIQIQEIGGASAVWVSTVSGGDFKLRIYSTIGGAPAYEISLPLSGKLEVKNSNVLHNGISVGTIPLITLDMVNPTIDIGKLANLTAYFMNGSIFGLSINTEQFNLTEGLGNEVFGSNGTIGTIHTSNAQGIERTNFGQWLKGSDDIGWYDYNSFTPYLVGTSSLVGSSIIS